MTTSSRERWLSEWEEPAGSPTAMVTFQDEAWLQRFGLPNESNVVDYLRPSAFMPTAADEELVVDRQATVPGRDAAQPDTLVVRRRNANDETLAMCVPSRARDDFQLFALSLTAPHVPSLSPASSPDITFIEASHTRRRLPMYSSRRACGRLYVPSGSHSTNSPGSGALSA